jgi:cellulose synthase/poly-beta-1,6-N-acetylglucosamine synthase-like glycosyltransferase
MKFSFAITVCNELKEIKQLLPNLLENKQIQDEIVILYDEENGTPEVLEYLLSFNKLPNVQTWRKSNFNSHFADWKNQFLEYCTGDYIVQIDADELPSDEFWTYLPAIFESNRGLADSFYISRRNTVDGLTQEHITKWGWKVQNIDGKDLINFPDWQHRIFKNNGTIKWKNKVHEVLEGYGSLSYIPAELFLWHHKDIKRQEKQNAYYDTL